MRLAAVMWAVLALVTGVGIITVKYQVQALEDVLHAKERQIERDRSAIRVLQAEWAYLNDPSRLRRLSEEHLAFGQPSPKDVIAIDSLPFREMAEATAPEMIPSPAAAPPAEADSDTAPAAPSVRAAATPNRPGTLPVSFARLQRLLAPVWPGTIQFRLPDTGVEDPR